ncbi:hypothetical protein BV22DRAFT_1120940 [Leucogyrophana mollusca]|uniref:Uncharacterized protein n=1 Tax=Leucogyrophana mollusca TaxID=85980 RepID=A0ACB8BC39_9AGAM|nr:hypothetical protein BV22DRAFT_1120940 [Leucogyrophana mollusca]
MRSLAIFAILATAGGLASAGCSTHTPSGAGHWRIDVYSKPNCGGSHHELTGFRSNYQDEPIICSCVPLKDFPHSIESISWSPAKMPVRTKLGVSLFTSSNCKGKSLGYATGSKHWDVSGTATKAKYFNVCSFYDV